MTAPKQETPTRRSARTRRRQRQPLNRQQPGTTTAPKQAMRTKRHAKAEFQLLHRQQLSLQLPGTMIAQRRAMRTRPPAKARHRLLRHNDQRLHQRRGQPHALLLLRARTPIQAAPMALPPSAATTHIAPPLIAQAPARGTAASLSGIEYLTTKKGGRKFARPFYFCARNGRLRPAR